ncbi:MAG TPA: hypothetical protein VHP32_06745 [Ignavibacteria bacterium]|nr:hypothetical protein [Ignavibacteria bacterium]
MWNTNTQNNPSDLSDATKVTCNSNSYDVIGLSGVQLVERIKQIARENSIGKFDIFDSNCKNVNPQDIQAGNFEGDLKVIRFNVAASIAV